MSFRQSKLLLNQAKLILREIETSYGNYLLQKEVSEELQMFIKDYLDKVTPALDFAAFEIFTTFCVKNVSPEKLSRAESKIYFPFKKNILDFESYIKQVFPGLLEDRPDIVEVFKKYQPFPLRSQWLYYLRELSRHNKHRNFTKQTYRQTTHVNSLHLPGGGGMFNVTFVTDGNAVPISFGGQPFNFENPPKNIGFDGSIEIDYVFSDLDLPVLKTLKRIYASAPTVINDLEQILEG